MDDNATAATVENLELPKESRVSYIMNGLGNGLMIGGVPAIIAKFMQNQTGFFKHDVQDKKLMVFTGAFAAVGAAYGWYEGVRVHNYRQAVKDEIVKLRKEVSEHRNWHERQDERKAQPEIATTR